MQQKCSCCDRHSWSAQKRPQNYACGSHFTTVHGKNNFLSHPNISRGSFAEMIFCVIMGRQFLIFFAKTSSILSMYRVKSISSVLNLFLNLYLNFYVTFYPVQGFEIIVVNNFMRRLKKLHYYYYYYVIHYYYVCYSSLSHWTEVRYTEHVLTTSYRYEKKCSDICVSLLFKIYSRIPSGGKILHSIVQ